VTFHLIGTPLIERFELVLVDLQSATGTLRVPLVDSWFEVQLAIDRVPDQDDRKTFFASLGNLAATLRERQPDLRWYFLHKLPGLKLRFRIGGADVLALDTILSTVLDWRFPWLTGVAIGSVFDQAELLNAPFRQDVEHILTLAADQHLVAVAAEYYCSAEAWAEFLIQLLESLRLDRWLSYEAFARLGRLRAVELSSSRVGELPLMDPRGMLASGLPECTPGFEASASLLQGLNLLFNIWGVDDVAQSRILAMACSKTRSPFLSADA
jgi:hypothetical protein